MQLDLSAHSHHFFFPAGNLSLLHLLPSVSVSSGADSNIYMHPELVRYNYAVTISTTKKVPGNGNYCRILMFSYVHTFLIKTQSKRCYKCGF